MPEVFDPLFEVHMLNDGGKVKARNIAELFNGILDDLTMPITLGSIASREMSLVKTHLEIACFYAKKAMANQKENQQ